MQSVESMGAGWCPPGILGIGIGGNADKAMALAKQALSEPIDMADLIRRGPSNRTEELRLEIAERVNALGIGAQVWGHHNGAGRENQILPNPCSVIARRNDPELCRNATRAFHIGWIGCRGIYTA